jgi:protein phosphatase
MSDDYSYWKQCLQISALSDLGLRRSNNQDSMTIALARDMDDWKVAGHLFLVADGMGAHAAGELASKIAVDQIAHLYRKRLDMSAPAAISEAIREANDEIHRRGQANLAFHNMGTTCSGLVLLPQGALVAHVGDSRVYRLQNGQLNQLTFDHSLVWEMRHLAGQSEVDTAGIPKNVITRSLGPHADVKVDLEGPFPTELGDTFLICSDGLTGCVSDEEIASALNSCSPADATKLLLGLAILRGAPDNVTIIVVRIVDEKMTTRNARAAPLIVGDTYEPTVAAPVWAWVILGILLLLAGGLWALGHSMWGLFALAAAALPGFFIVAVEAGLMRDTGIQLTSGRRLGKAPYQKAAAMKPEQFKDHILHVVEQGCDAAKEKNWEIDWSGIDKLKQQSAENVSAADPLFGLRPLLRILDTLTEHCRVFTKNAESRS